MPSTTSQSTSEQLVLCHLGPCQSAPSLSTFVIKLQTYLKMVDLPFKQEFTFKMSSKGKFPYIKHEGKEIADTNFIIPFLNEKYGKDLDASLNPGEQAISLAFKRLVEENLYWTLTYYRWIDNSALIPKLLPVTGLRKRFLPIVSALSLKPGVKSSLHGHGMGRHSKEEIYSIMEKDLKALSDFLGEKEYFMGSEPTEIDASLFGFLVHCLYVTPECPHGKVIREKFENLLHHTDRMKERYWSDWDDLCVKEKKKEEPVEQKEEEPEENGAKKDQEEEKNEEAVEEAAGDAKAEEKPEQPAEEQKEGSPEK